MTGRLLPWVGAAEVTWCCAWRLRRVPTAPVVGQVVPAGARLIFLRRPARRFSIVSLQRRQARRTTKRIVMLSLTG
jgi:hypothetical protein